MTEKNIPVLTDRVGGPGEAAPAVPDELTDEERAELRSRLTDVAFALIQRLMYRAIKEMESTLLDDVLDEVRRELPTLIDQVFEEHLDSIAPRPGRES
jgi:hypothetical protein